jgi:hypothetical protein
MLLRGRVEYRGYLAQHTNSLQQPPVAGAADRVWPHLHLCCSHSTSIPTRVYRRQLVETRLELYPSAATVPTVGPRFIASTLRPCHQPTSESRQNLTASCARLNQGSTVDLPTCPFAPDLQQNPCSHTCPHQPASAVNRLYRKQRTEETLPSGGKLELAGGNSSIKNTPRTRARFSLESSLESGKT